MRWRRRRQSLYQSQLCTVSKVSIAMRTLLRTVPKLSLDGLDAFAAGRSLARDRVSSHIVVRELPQADGPLHLAQWTRVTVAKARPVAVFREQKLGSRIALLDVP